MERRSLFAFGSNESANPVAASSRAMRVARRSTDGREIAGRQNLAVRLQRDGIDRKVGVRIERISHASDGIQPRDAAARLSADVAEIAARQNLAVRLHRD